MTCASTGQAEVIYLKGGTFVPLYGNNKKPVTVSDFIMDKFPVTNGEFLSFVKEKPEWQKSKAKKLFVDSMYLKHWHSDLDIGERTLPTAPVVNVSWYAAKAYCESKGLRLPTVYEWEYVASRPIPGIEIKKLILDWYSRPSPEILPPVTTGLINGSGVAALHGLIWEWNLDFNSAMVTGESRADGSLDKNFYCGAGSSNAADAEDYAAFLRFGFRSSLKAKYTVANLGFRCVKDVEKK